MASKKICEHMLFLCPRNNCKLQTCTAEQMGPSWCGNIIPYGDTDPLNALCESCNYNYERALYFNGK
uniref:Uncharacterized protein n=1 Tax=viral metagenome TaxID=1070528 RepID=A0A6C0J679_9ZZZZ